MTIYIYMEIFLTFDGFGYRISLTDEGLSEKLVLEGGNILKFLLNREDCRLVKWAERRERAAERLYYNAGDMLGMRLYDTRAGGTPEQLGPFYPWPRAEGPELTEFIERSKSHAKTHFPKTIVDYFYSHTFEELTACSFPSHELLRASVNKYFNECSTDSDSLQVRQPRTLTVHIRIGDMGDARHGFFNHLEKLLGGFDSCLVLLGLHMTTVLGGPDGSDIILKSYVETIRTCLLLSKKIRISCASADEHLCIMYEASNLLVHRGGFSLLGMILCKGKVFYTSEMEPRMNKKLIQDIGDKDISMLQMKS